MPSTSGKKILIFGDSLSSGPASPGVQLADKLDGAEVKISAVVGRSAWNFFTTREDSAAVLADCKAFGADIAIVELGTNDIGLSTAADKAAFIRLRDALANGGATEVWAIGPPAFAKAVPQANGVDAVVATMRDVFGSRFVDWQPLSRDMTSSPPRTADGVHFTANGGRVAGSRLADEFTRAGGIGIGTVVLVGVLAWAILR